MAETDAMTAASLEVLNVKAWIRRAKACRAQGNFPDASKCTQSISNINQERY